MKRFFVAVAVVASVVFVGPFARAQPQQQFGEKGEFILDADRLMPLLTYAHFSRDLPPPGGTTGASHSGDNTTLGLFYGSTLDLNAEGGGDFPSSAFFAVPRLGFDYVFTANMTIGADLVVFGTLGGGQSTETTFANGTAMTSQQTSQSLALFGLAPRFGYIMKLTDGFSLWLRGGLSFYYGTLKTSGAAGNALSNDSEEHVALDLEPQLVYTPIPHVGFTAAVNADLSPSFAGGYTHTDNLLNVSVSKSSDVVFLGITLGLVAYF
jgi:hypothetical protein